MKWVRASFLVLALLFSPSSSWGQSSPPVSGESSLPPWPSLEPVLSSVLDWSCVSGAEPYALATLDLLETYATESREALEAISSENKLSKSTSEQALRDLKAMRPLLRRLEISSRLGWATAGGLAIFLVSRWIK